MLDWFLSTLTPTPTESHMPSTAEIIQKCLTVNPFDVKFREANMQINGQTPEQAAEQRLNGAQLGLPTTPAGLTALKLPSSIAQSPSLFGNVLPLELDELRKNLDFTRKVQQLRDSSTLVKQEGNRTPCTADVLNAVLDMNMNQQTLSIPSTSSLVAGLSAAAAAVASSNNNPAIAPTATVNSVTSDAISSAAESLLPVNNAATSSAAAAMVSNIATNGFAFPAPSDSASISQPGIAASTAAALFQQHQTSIATMISNQNSLNALNTSANQSMPNLHAGFQATATSSGPASNGLMAPRASPALSNISPRSTSHLMELQKHSNGSTFPPSDPHRAASVDPWDSNAENYSMYEATHGRLELKTDGLGGMNAASSESSLSSQPNSHLATDSETKPHRKYARYHNADGVPTGRGGRGRRSITSEMPPDERRMTILERNKAAAVRYRKRKKEEHDEMIGRVHGLEQDKAFLQTQNTALRRENDRLTELLKHCVCSASGGIPRFTSRTAETWAPVGRPN
ncbi:BZIP domain-containing protein [Aphelenchoides fujianensis]|nr:BZIP domain-containing protein [Aphelenchoides fujianensis]